MKNLIKSFIIITATGFLMSFISVEPNKFVGTYKVGADNPSQLALVLNADQTFSFQDYSNQNRKISVHGNWIQKGRKVVLVSKSGDVDFHSVWKFESEGQIARSRKGMTFYRLCKSAD